jgi:hypothetical protein
MADPTIEIEDEDELDQWQNDQDEHDELATDAGGRSEAALSDTESLDEWGEDYADQLDDDLVPDVPADPAMQEVLDLRAELDDAHQDGAPDGPFEVVVTGVDEDGVITCVPDTRAEQFAAFAEHHLGRTVALRLDEVRVFPRDREPVLLARHAESAFTIAVDPRHIGTGLRYPQLRRLEQNASWDFELLAADQERLVPELSQTDMTLRALTRLAGDRSPFRTTAEVVDVFLDTIFLQIGPDPLRVRPDDPPLVLRAFARELPQAPERIKLGASVPVVLRWLTRRRETVDIGFVDASKLPPGPWEVHGDDLVATGPLGPADWHRLIDFSDGIEDFVAAARFRALVSRLATRALSPRVRVIDEQLFAAAVDDGRVEAQIVAQLPDGALRVLTPLGEQVIGSSEADLYRALGNSTNAASTVPIFVDRMDTDFASFTVRLFDPAERGRLTVGDVVDTRTGSLTASKREVHVHTLTGVEGLARVETLPHSHGDIVPMRVVELPDDGLIRFSGRHIRRLVAISPQLAAVIQSGPSDRGGWDLRPFTSQTDACDVTINGAPPVELEVCNDGTPAGRHAADQLVTASTGSLWQVAVPHHQPLRANKREILGMVSSETGCILIDGQRKNDRGYSDNFVWIAAPRLTVATIAADRIRSAYSQVWVSEWFKRTGGEWGAATAAVKALSGRLRAVRAIDARGKPIFRAVLECSPGEEVALLTAARAVCPSIPYGAFTADPSITVTEITQSPLPMETTPSPAPKSTWQPTMADKQLPLTPSAQTPTSSWAPRPTPGPGRGHGESSQPAVRPPTASWQPTPSPKRPTRPQPPRPRTLTRSGPTVEKALSAACAELGVDTTQVTYVVIDEGRRRLFGRSPAQVRVTLR